MYDFITVGSGTVDVFVRTSKKGTELKADKKHVDVCFQIGQKILVDFIEHHTGGGGTNTAVAFSRLGFKTAWLGKLGNDNNSKIVKSALKKEKVDVLAKSAKGETGYSVILTELNKNRTILAFKGINDKLKQTEVPWRKLKTKWFYCSSMMGSSFGTLKKVVAHAKKNNIRYAFNPSMYVARQGLKKLGPIINDCDILVLNKEEATALAGKKTAPLNTLLKTLQRHAKIVVVTDGAKGAVAYNGINKYTIKARKIKVVETTGAGDAFAAGFVAGIVRYNDIAKAMKLGIAESESVITHIGAKADLLTKRKAATAINKRHKITITKL